MKLKKILIILMTLIVVVVVSTLLHYQNMNYISENWNIDFPSENTIVYQVKPSPSFTLWAFTTILLLAACLKILSK